MCTVRGGQNAFSKALRALEAISAFEGINTARREVLVVNRSTNSKFLPVSPLSCVMCSRLLCPYLVCFLSLFSVIISLFCSAVCVLIILCIYSPVCSV